MSGLSARERRARWNIHLPPRTSADGTAVESRERQELSPRLSWSPGANEPPGTVTMVAPANAFWLLRVKMPLLSQGTR